MHEMTPRYFLGETDHYRYERRARWSFCSEPYRNGCFRLFNKNALRTAFVKIVDQCPKSAQLLQDIAQQIQALAVGQEIAVRRDRIALGVAIAAGAVAICAGIIALVW